MIDFAQQMRMRVRLLATCLLALAMTVQIDASGTFAQTTPAEPPQAQGGPQDPRSTQSDTRPGESLSERLDRTDGVIRPPSNIVPQMPQARPPAPDPGTTPVIPPPGTPGGNQGVEPK
jgi:hypothetical protein